MVTVALLFAVGCTSSKPNVVTSSTVRANTTPSVGSTTLPSAADAILSACVTHQSRSELAATLSATGRTQAQVDLLLEQFDAMVRTGDC